MPLARAARAAHINPKIHAPRAKRAGGDARSTRACARAPPNAAPAGGKARPTCASARAHAHHPLRRARTSQLAQLAPRDTHALAAKPAQLAHARARSRATRAVRATSSGSSRSLTPGAFRSCWREWAGPRQDPPFRYFQRCPGRTGGQPQCPPNDRGGAARRGGRKPAVASVCLWVPAKSAPTMSLALRGVQKTGPPARPARTERPLKNT